MKQFCGYLGMMGEQDVGKDGGAGRSILGDRPALPRAAYKGPHVRVESEEEQKLVGAKDRSKRLIWHW